MKISALCVVYNGERYIAAALESVLEQSRPVDEIIVVDDGSTDGTAEIVKRFHPRVGYHRIEHAGISRARQVAIEASSGDLLAFIDADDLWVQEKTEWQFNLLNERHELDVVYGKLRNFISPDMPETEANLIRANLEPMAGLGATAAMFRRELFDRVPYHVTNWQVGEFIDWCMRARAAGAVMFEHEEVVAMRRIHGSNSSRTRRDNYRDYLHIVKGALERKRSKTRQEEAERDRT